MFWGLVLENGKRYNQVVDDGFHVSMAVLEPQSNKSSTVSVMMEREKTEFLLCTLQNGKCQQQALDLNFAEGEVVTLFLNGEGIVHLTGYVIEAEPDGQEFPYSEEESDEETLDIEQHQKLKRKAENDKPMQGLPKRTKLAEDSDNESDSDEYDLNLECTEDEEISSESNDSDDSDQQLIMKQKQAQSPKKAAGKSPILGVPLSKQQMVSTKPSATPSKNATKAQPATPTSVASAQPVTPRSVASAQLPLSKSAKKQQARSKDASKKTKQNQSPMTPAPTANGDQSLNQSGEGSKKKKKKRKKNKNLNESNVAGSPGATPGKNSDEKGQNVKKLLGGTIVEDLHVGNGPEAKLGKMAHVHYIGKLKNNKEFDSCLKGQEPFKFRLGQNEVIKGWDTGIQGMKVGGRRTITVPPNQAYGNKQIGLIPPNSTLKFDVQLVAVS